MMDGRQGLYLIFRNRYDLGIGYYSATPVPTRNGAGQDTKTPSSIFDYLCLPAIALAQARPPARRAYASESGRVLVT